MRPLGPDDGRTPIRARRRLRRSARALASARALPRRPGDAGDLAATWRGSDPRRRDGTVPAPARPVPQKLMVTRTVSVYTPSGTTCPPGMRA